MTQFIGTEGYDVADGAVGVADEFVTAALQRSLDFYWDGNHWVVTGGGQAEDILTSIDKITMDDAVFTATFARGETQVSLNAGQQPALIGLAGGGHIALWEYGSDIYARRYSSNGEPLNDAAIVNTTTTSTQSNSAGTALSNGGYAIVWQSYDGGTGTYEIRMQRYSASGTPAGSEIPVNTTTAGEQSAPQIIQLAGGDIVVGWTSANQDDGISNGAYFQRFTASGAAVGPETLINTTTAFNQEQVALVVNGNGFVAVWTSTNQDGSGSGIYMQRFRPDGTALGAETLVNTQTSGNQDEPVIASNGDGFMIAWGSNGDIHAQRFSTNGAALGDEFVVNGTTTSTQYQPSIAALGNGGYVVTWTGYNPENGTYDIYAQRFDESGATAGPETIVNELLPSHQTSSMVAALSNGGYAVTWYDPNYGRIMVREYNSDGLATLPSLTGDDRHNFIDASRGTAAVALDGGEGNDTLIGGDGADILTGGNGTDTMRGGAGDDNYYADATDRIVENAGSGSDTVWVAESFTLTRNLENLVLTGEAASQLLGNNLDNELTGNTADNVLNGRGGNDVMRGGLGNDTYYVNASGDLVIENTDAGIDTVMARGSFELEANVENLRLLGAGNYDASGNELDNIITGNSGANVLLGDAGADILSGERGNDTYYVDALDQVVEAANGGIDTVVAEASWTLDANFENLTLAEGGAFNATGNDLANVITGNSANNVIDGGRGADTMNGGNGDDIYFVDHAGDIASEFGSSTNDLVNSSVSHTLGNGIENLTLLGNGDIDGTGNTLNNVIRGTAGANRLSGDYGNDTLYGGLGQDTLSGGFGTDTLYGGGGNDLYLVTDDVDETVELRDQGIDTVWAEVQQSYALERNVENLVLFGGDIAGYGNDLRNEITGTAGSNLLDGGEGADTMTGLAGDDTFVVDSTKDTVVEAADEGIDLVLSAINFSLVANVENLTLTGVADINGGGNGLDNSISGNHGDNFLTGGNGDDTLVGSGGNDVLKGEQGKDILIGGAGADRLDGGFGNDTASYALASGGVVVDLRLTGQQNTVSAGIDRLIGIENIDGSQTGGDTLTGDGLNNRLNGNGGDDTLAGGGGNDTLTGGEGDDVITADAGDDIIDGGNGIDRLSFSGVSGPVTVDLTLTRSQDTGSGIDRIRNIEILEGSSSNDTLSGDHGANSLFGLGGNDILAGGEGEDLLNGGGGNDTADYSLAYGDVTADLSAGIATDDGFGSTDQLVGIEHLTGSEFNDFLTGNGSSNRIVGGYGQDEMRGKGGNDVFVLRSADETGINANTRDVIADFTSGDRIDLSSIDADTGTAGVQDFTAMLASGTAFSAAGQLKLENGILYGNTDGDAQAEFTIELLGVSSLSLGDFIL